MMLVLKAQIDVALTSHYTIAIILNQLIDTHLLHSRSQEVATRAICDCLLAVQAVASGIILH